MSVIALRLLQVVGHSREKGVTGQELTQLLDVDPKSMHHYVKVLLRLKLVYVPRNLAANCT
jgi:DNA-binding IclR family transcriptional regulator